MVTNKFCNFYLLKNYKIANNSSANQAREKKSCKDLRFSDFFWCTFEFAKINYNQT